MGVLQRSDDGAAVATAKIAPAPRRFGRTATRRTAVMACLLFVATFALGQVVTHGSPAIAARTNPRHSTQLAASTSQSAARVQLARSSERVDMVRIANSLRDGALSVAQANSTARARELAKARSLAKARARARARATAREQSVAKEHAKAKTHQGATPKQSPTHKNSTQTSGSTAALALSLAANVAPNPDFMSTCSTPSNSYFCLGQEAEAIDNARALEGLEPLNLNLSAFRQLSAPEQIFVLTNLERTSRGLTPAIALTSQLDATSLRAARETTDPTLNGWTLAGNKQAVAWNSNWSGGMSVTESDYYWMYADGAGYNVDCTASVTTGCWEHRANVLESPAESCPGAMAPQFVMGAGATATASYNPSAADILVQVCGGIPSDAIFSWPQAEKLLGIPVG